MSGLLHALNVGSQSLMANRQGVDTTAHNIANAQTEGYSRQHVELQQRDPLIKNNLLIGDGVYVGGIKRSHDQFIEKQLNFANGDFGGSEARQKGIAAIETIYSPEVGSNISSEMNNFFGALQNLGNNPEDQTVRTAVMEQGRSLGQVFNRIDGQLRETQRLNDDLVRQGAQDCSDLLRGIAKINEHIRTLEANGDANDLCDQRDKLVRELSRKIDVNYYTDQHGMLTVRGCGDLLLVEGSNCASFNTQRNPENDGHLELVSNDFEGHMALNVTHRLQGGALHGVIDVRDRVAAGMIDKTNELAATFCDAFNDIHRKGFGVNDFRAAAGNDFFKCGDDPSVAAREMRVSNTILSSVDAIAAGSTPNAPGDNVNLNRMIQLQGANIMGDSGINFTDFYADSVGELGIEALRSRSVMDASKIVREDLLGRRESVSGVSLDEEATNLIRWQSAFTASSKVITTVDEMIDTVLGMKR